MTNPFHAHVFAVEVTAGLFNYIYCSDFSQLGHTFLVADSFGPKKSTMTQYLENKLMGLEPGVCDWKYQIK